MNNDDVKKVLPLFEGAAETGKIKKKSFNFWVVIKLVITQFNFSPLNLNDNYKNDQIG